MVILLILYKNATFACIVKGGKNINSGHGKIHLFFFNIGLNWKSPKPLWTKFI